MTTRKPRRKKTSPIFLELAELEPDDWWKNILMEMGDGFFPHRLSYSNSTLFFRTRAGKYNNLVIDPNFDLQMILEQIKVFLRTIVGLIPNQEFVDFNNLPEEEISITWELLNKKENIREILIWNYLTSLNLSPREFTELKRDIWWGFVKGKWTAKTFTIDKNQIVAFDPEEVKVTKPRTRRKKVS